MPWESPRMGTRGNTKEGKIQIEMREVGEFYSGKCQCRLVNSVHIFIVVTHYLFFTLRV